VALIQSVFPQHAFPLAGPCEIVRNFPGSCDEPVHSCRYSNFSTILSEQERLALPSIFADAAIDPASSPSEALLMNTLISMEGLGSGNAPEPLLKDEARARTRSRR